MDNLLNIVNMAIDKQLETYPITTGLIIGIFIGIFLQKNILPD